MIFFCGTVYFGQVKKRMFIFFSNHDLLRNPKRHLAEPWLRNLALGNRRRGRLKKTWQGTVVEVVLFVVKNGKAKVLQKNPNRWR
jgi:hypothetical protein